MKKISIITVNRDNASGLRKTLASASNQDCKDFEHIVIDGGSRDGSVEVIREYSERIDYWVSEPDRGIYQAMNKGIRASGGEYCVFLNSGDWLYDETAISRLTRAVRTGKDIYYADLPSPDDSGRFLRFPDHVGLAFFISGSLNHQNTAIKRSCLKKHGLYNEDNKIMSDWEFFLVASMDPTTTFERMARPIAYYIHDGMSADPRNEELRLSEVRRVLLTKFGEELGAVLNEYVDYRHSVYHDILDMCGYSKPFAFLLKAYRYCARRLKKR